MSANPSTGTGGKKTLVTCAAIGSFLWAAIMTVLVFLQLVVAATNRDDELTALGYWNLVIVAVYVVIGIGILTRKNWAWDWGIGSNALNFLFGIYELTQGRLVNVLLLPIELLIVVALYATGADGPESPASVAPPAQHSAPAPYVAPERGVSAPAMLSVTKAILITLALLLLWVLVAFALQDANAATVLLGLMVLGTSLWAAIDWSRLRLRDYWKQLSVDPVLLFFCMWLLWIVLFPSYLVVRSRIKAGVMPRLQDAGQGRSGSALKVVLWIGGVLALIAVVCAALFISTSGSVNNIWQAANSRLVRAAKQSPVADSSLTTSPGGSAQPAATPTGAEVSAPAPTLASSDVHLQTYAGRLPDKAFWVSVDRIFSGNLVGEGSEGTMALNSFENNLDTYIFAPCQYDAQTNTMTVTWRGRSKPEEGDIAGSLSENNAISFDPSNPVTGIVATFSDSGGGASLTFYAHGRYSPSDANRIASGDLSALPEDLREWGAALMKQSGKPVTIDLE